LENFQPPPPTEKKIEIFQPPPPTDEKNWKFPAAAAEKEIGLHL
jgi:hypothetical protein